MAAKIRPRWNHWLFKVDCDRPAPKRVVRRFQKPQDEFDIAFLEDILVADPEHLETMKMLAELYTRTGQCRQGLHMDRLVVAATPMDPVANYNLACSLSLMRRLDECFTVLRRAVRLGYRDMDHMANDADLDAAHKDARWLELFDLIEV
jgi:hypothetical protein